MPEDHALRVLQEHESRDTNTNAATPMFVNTPLDVCDVFPCTEAPKLNRTPICQGCEQPFSATAPIHTCECHGWMFHLVCKRKHEEHFGGRPTVPEPPGRISRITIPYDTTTTTDKVDKEDDLRSRYLMVRHSDENLAESAGASLPAINTAKYKLKNRTDQQAKLFPDLQKEIAERRSRLNADVRDQKSEAYKQEICDKVKELKLCPPEHHKLLCSRILRPFSDRFWDEGCAAPAIKGFKANIQLKPGAQVKFRQPYSLSKFDRTRLAYLYEEAEQEGKVEMYQLGDRPPPVCTPVFIVDKKGSLIGRKVGDFTLFNQVSEDYYHPAPEADKVLLDACGKEVHSVFDCVWGFEQIDLDDPTSEILSTITPFGTFKSKKMPMGIKQGPAIYQHLQDHAFCNEFKPCGDKLCDPFFDDTHAGDHTVDEHVETLTHILTVARKFNIQYRLTKCVFFQPEVLLLGFICSVEGRRPDPKKVEQLKAWPMYKNSTDIASHLAFCNYLREFFGPDYSEKTKPLRAYLKKGSDFTMFEKDTEAQRARTWLMNQTLEHCILVVPDWNAAAEPWLSGRPFEGYGDASDLSWCIVLCQRDKPDGTPRIIAFVCKTFSDEATRWSAFEREFYCFKEGYAAIAKYVEGFPLFMYFDHKNVERAEAVLKSRRASKKLVNWVADCQHILFTVVRIWIDGKNNILADAGSRASWENALVKHMPIPNQPILETIRLFFRHPNELEEAVEVRRKEMDTEPWTGIAWFPPVKTLPIHVPDHSLAGHSEPVSRPERPAPKASEVSAPASSRSRTTHRQSSSSGLPSTPRAAQSSELPSTPRPPPAASSRSRSRGNSSVPSDVSMPSEDISSENFCSDISSEAFILIDDSEVQPRAAAKQRVRTLTTVVEEESASRHELLDRHIGSDLYKLLTGENFECPTEAQEFSVSVLSRSLHSLASYGTNYCFHFLEISSDTAVLTQAVVFCGLTTLTPVDKHSGWNLASTVDTSRLRLRITEWRPLLTHIAPGCKLFNTNFSPVYDIDAGVDEATYLESL